VRLPPIPELTSPLPLAAVGVLALNDHVLKRSFPGLVTGKLSDVAGCFVLPLFVSAVLAVVTTWPRARRLAVGALVTAVFFAAIKVSPGAARAVAAALALAWRPVIGGTATLLADPTDLVALPCAWLAYAWGVRAGAAPARVRGAEVTP
jgi:Na+-transporting NADH:ubiquinone oxidoreductase subunit NqrB